MIRAAVLAAFLLVIAGAAIALPGQADPRPPRLALQRATSPLSHSNSRDGQAILTATGMRPGERRSGKVTIKNEGGNGGIALATTATGPMAERLRLTVSDSAGAVLDAPLAGAPACLPLGDLNAGVARKYRFTVTFERGENDNAYAGASARADFEWVDRCAPAPAAPALALDDTRVAVDPGPYRFAARAGTARVGVRCLASPAGACRGRIQLDRRQPHHGRGIALAVGRFRVPAGKRRTITLRLNARARRLVARKGSVPVLASLTVAGRRAAYRDTLRYPGRSSSRNATSSR